MIDNIELTKHVRRLFLLIAIFALFSATANTTGKGSGILKDSAGTPVAGAQITLVDAAKGTTITAKTDRKGSYVFPLVFPGQYTLHAEAKGFVPQDRLSVVVHVDSLLRIDLTLETEKSPE